MKTTKTILISILAGMLFFLESCCTPEIIGNVPNVLSPQETDNWCWAATTKMLAAHFGITVNQCDLANKAFGLTSCCNDEPSDNACRKTNVCNMPGWPMLDFVGLKFSENETALSWESLRTQIFCSKKPMAYAYGTPDVTGHVLVIKGYVTLAGTNYVVLNDPWSPCSGEERLITYDEYVDPAGSATHWRTIFDIAKK
jgi:hypothetical protein